MAKRRNKSERKKKRVSAGTRKKRLMARRRVQRGFGGYLLPALSVFPLLDAQRKNWVIPHVEIDR